MSQPPTPRQIDSWQAAEHNAADWMRHWGYADSRVTTSGSDGGIDVRSDRALAQVKWEARQIGRPVLNALVGARGREHSKDLLFFTGTGYSAPAITYADEMGIALFKYGLDGSMTAVNGAARRLIASATRRSADAGDSGGSAPVGRPAGLGCAIVAAVFSTVAVAVLAGVYLSEPAASDATLALSGGFWGLVAVGSWAAVIAGWLQVRGTRTPTEPIGLIGPPVATPAQAERQTAPGAEPDDGLRRLPDGGWLSPGTATFFDYRAPVELVMNALYAIHANGGGQPPVVEAHTRRVTIAPNWVEDYLGLVNMTARLEPITSSRDQVTRVHWSTHSNATEATAEEAADAAHLAAERANDLLRNLLG